MEMNSLNQDYEATSQHPSKLKKLISRRAITFAAGLTVALGAGSSYESEAYAYQTPLQESPAGLMIRDKIQTHVQAGDGYVEKALLLSHNSYSDIGENMLSQVDPQGVKRVVVKINGRDAKLSILNTDSESALISPSNVAYPGVNGEMNRVPYVDQIDSDEYLHNERQAQIFKVSKPADWLKRSKWRKVTPPVNFNEWTETEINSPIPQGEIRDPFSAFKSPLTKWETAESKTRYKVSKKEIALGLVAVQLTKKWSQINDADGYRQGYHRTLYRFPTSKKGEINTEKPNYIIDSSKEKIVFKYSDQRPIKSTTKSFSKKFKDSIAQTNHKISK